MEQNRYAPTEATLSAAVEAAGAGEQALAGRGRRLANLLIDTLGYFLLSAVVGVAIGLVDPSFVTGLSRVGEYLFGFAVMLLYYVPCELLFGRTLGKLITGTRVVAESGEPLRFLQVVGRTATRFVPFEAFTFLGSRPGLHDRWSETRVVLLRSP